MFKLSLFLFNLLFWVLYFFSLRILYSPSSTECDSCPTGAFRDNNGIRPLSIGVRKGKIRNDYIISSEDALFTPLGYEKLRDVDPGEAVFITSNGQLKHKQCSENPTVFVAKSGNSRIYSIY